MGCNCKQVKDVKELGKLMTPKKEKIPFLMKIEMILDFFTFYFIFVNTSIFNLIFHDKLEPSFPKRLIKKYSMYDG